jgi:hypothetical protein
MSRQGTAENFLTHLQTSNVVGRVMNSSNSAGVGWKKHWTSTATEKGVRGRRHAPSKGRQHPPAQPSCDQTNTVRTDAPVHELCLTKLFFGQIHHNCHPYGCGRDCTVHSRPAGVCWASFRVCGSLSRLSQVREN